MTVWWNPFWKFLIEYLKHVMKCQNVILTLHFTLQDENVKCDVNVRIKIKIRPSFPRLIIWRRLDDVQIKQTSNPIRNTVKYCVKTRYLIGKIHNGSE